MKSPGQGSSSGRKGAELCSHKMSQFSDKSGFFFLIIRAQFLSLEFVLKLFPCRSMSKFKGEERMLGQKMKEILSQNSP